MQWKYSLIQLLQIYIRGYWVGMFSKITLDYVDNTFVLVKNTGYFLQFWCRTCFSIFAKLEGQTGKERIVKYILISSSSPTHWSWQMNIFSLVHSASPTHVHSFSHYWFFSLSFSLYMLLYIQKTQLRTNGCTCTRCICEAIQSTL